MFPKFLNYVNVLFVPVFVAKVALDYLTYYFAVEQVDLLVFYKLLTLFLNLYVLAFCFFLENLADFSVNVYLYSLTEL